MEKPVPLLLLKLIELISRIPLRNMDEEKKDAQHRRLGNQLRRRKRIIFRRIILIIVPISQARMTQLLRKDAFQSLRKRIHISLQGSSSQIARKQHLRLLKLSRHIQQLISLSLSEHVKSQNQLTIPPFHIGKFSLYGRLNIDIIPENQSRKLLDILLET